VEMTVLQGKNVPLATINPGTPRLQGRACRRVNAKRME